MFCFVLLSLHNILFLLTGRKHSSNKKRDYIFPSWLRVLRVTLIEGGGWCYTRVCFVFVFLVCAARLQDCVCVLCNKRLATGVNMLEKSDLGQWPCLHLSRWRAAALGGGIEERLRDEPRLSRLLQMEKRQPDLAAVSSLDDGGDVTQTVLLYKPNHVHLFIEDQDI